MRTYRIEYRWERIPDAAYVKANNPDEAIALFLADEPERDNIMVDAAIEED